MTAEQIIHQYQDIPRSAWTSNDWADFQRYSIGLNVIPAMNNHSNPDKCKKPFWLDDQGNEHWIRWKEDGYQTEPISEEQHQEWKNSNAFKDGMALICGQIFHNKVLEGLWGNGIDCDNLLGITEFCGKHEDDSPRSLADIAKDTVVEQHANKNKCHVIINTKEPIKSKAPIDDDTKPKIEIKSGGNKLLYCAGGYHKDGSLIDIVGSEQVAEFPKDKLESKLNDIFKKYDIPYLEDRSTEKKKKIDDDVVKKLQLKTAGTDRQLTLLSIGTTFAKRTKGMTTEQQVIDYLIDANKIMKDSYPESRAVQIGKSCYKYAQDDEVNPEIEIKVELKSEWAVLKNNKSKQAERGVAKKNINELQRLLRSEITEWDEDEDIPDDSEKIFVNKEFHYVADIIQEESHFLTFRETNEIWHYDEIEGIYKPFGHTVIQEACQRLIHKCKRNAVAEVVDTIRRNKTMINMAELLESKHINTQNGIIDPRTFELKQHGPEYFTNTKLPFSVKSDARNLKLWKHILTIINPADINLLMELIWICISWNNPFKKLFVFKGITNTQKSTLADILVWIIGNENVSREKPTQFLSSKSRFSTSKFIGKRINIASEIGGLTEEMLENQKSMVGAELQNTEKKGDNTERYFDPTRFVFLYTTNKLGEIYSSINDNSVITRFQFLIFRNQIEETTANGQWYDDFFEDENDKQSAINTIVNIIIHYKKAQKLGQVPKTKWSTIAKTKEILKEQMSPEDKYFEADRIITKAGCKLTLEEIRADFNRFVGYKVNPQQMGNILKKQGFESKHSNGSTVYHDLFLTKYVVSGDSLENFNGK